VIDKSTRFPQHAGSYCFDISDVIGCPFVVNPIRRRFPFLSLTQKYDENNIAVFNPSTPQNFAAVGLIFPARQNVCFPPPRLVSVICVHYGLRTEISLCQVTAELNGTVRKLVPRAERSIFVAGLACNFCIG
jgi:hypothetical protein